jgi:signal transduction histidine kinase
MKALWKRLLDTWGVLAAPEPDLTQAAGRIRLVERDVGLPVKAGMLLAVGWFLYFSLNIEALANTSEMALEAVNALQQFFVAYTIVTAFLALPIWAFHQIPLKVMQWLVFVAALLDALFVAALTLVTDGFDSILFWVFPLLIVRNALSMPVAPLQFLLNFLLVAFYIAAGVLDLWILKMDLDPVQLVEPDEPAHSAEPFLLRIFLLILLSAICASLRVLLERERQRNVEAAEFSLRQEQFRTAGRLAAEIAHQIKNPLGIINNAAFSLQQSIGVTAGPAVVGQLQTIRDEVNRSDRIITELIGFAQLAEAHVERLDVVEEIEASIARVFPAGSGFTTCVQREFVPPLPVLLFSRRSLGEVFDNILKNARDVLNGQGTIRVGARYQGDFAVEVTIEDDGPGIPVEHVGRVFEAYFTTKSGGTGLGLAIVKQNVEMCGGSVQVESQVGKGTCFHLLFPGRTTLSTSN